MAVSTHHGSCHCGAIRFTVELDLEEPALVCNCSICRRTGAMLAFVAPDKLHVEQGQDALTDYLFNKHVIHHTFCKTCGVRPFSNGTGPHGPMYAVNVRTLDSVDVFTQPTKQWDGAAH